MVSSGESLRLMLSLEHGSTTDPFRGPTATSVVPGLPAPPPCPGDCLAFVSLPVSAGLTVSVSPFSTSLLAGPLMYGLVHDELRTFSHM